MFKTPIFFSVDKLSISSPGCFGNTRVHTPGLDSLAVKSCVYDRVYAEDADPRITLRKMWDSLDPISYPEGRFLLTDDAQIHPSSFFDDFLCVENFSQLTKMLECIQQELPDVFLWCHTQNVDINTLDSWVLTHEISALLSVRGMDVRKITEEDAPEENLRRNMIHHQEVQLPWWISFPDFLNLSGTRCKSLLAAEDFGKILRTEDPQNISREIIFIEDAPRWAVVTAEWFLTGDDRLDRKSEFPGELYLKPDDWWEQNDVSDRCPEIMEKLHALRSARFMPDTP
ncbi:MAG: hypothetical protein Q4C96_03745 [Planctomycetia bacterium]|nr:hypothetical protein [Planctomycetia bacterium]